MVSMGRAVREEGPETTSVKNGPNSLQRTTGLDLGWSLGLGKEPSVLVKSMIVLVATFSFPPWQRRIFRCSQGILPSPDRVAQWSAVTTQRTFDFLEYS